MSENKRNQELGMHCAITRRDFLNGVAVGAGGLLAADPLLATLVAEETAPEKAAGYYPPALTGMRGNHDGTFTYAHQLRDGKRWDSLGAAARSGETYDLVVVGGGIFLPQESGKECADFDFGQSRRFWRAREAQRISGRQADAVELWREAID